MVEEEEEKEARMRWRSKARSSQFFIPKLTQYISDFCTLCRKTISNNLACHTSSHYLVLKHFAGKFGCRRVKTRVKTTDMCLSGRCVADMLANMLATRHKKLLAGVLGQHVTACHLLTCRRHVGNMLALVAGIFAMHSSLGTASLA